MQCIFLINNAHIFCSEPLLQAEVPELSDDEEPEVEITGDTRPKAISFWKALLLPGVILVSK